MRHHSIMIHQLLITASQFMSRRQIIHSCAETVGAMPIRDATHLPERFLKSVTQGFKRLRVAQRNRLPVRVRQHAVKHHMVQPHPRDGDAQRIHAGEVRGGQLARMVFLRQDDISGRSLFRSPVRNAALQCATVGVKEPPRISPLHLLQQRNGLQSGFAIQQHLNLDPNLRKRILASSPGALSTHLRRQLPSLPVLPGRLVVHVGFPCRRRERFAAFQ